MTPISKESGSGAVTSTVAGTEDKTAWEPRKTVDERGGSFSGARDGIPWGASQSAWQDLQASVLENAQVRSRSI